MRNELIADIDSAIAAGTKGYFVNFRLSNGGKYAVQNTPARLNEFKSKVLACSGFRSHRTFTPPRIRRAPISEPATIVANFHRDGEFRNAYEASLLAGLEVGFGREISDTARLFTNISFVDIVPDRMMFVGQTFKNTHSTLKWVVVDIKTGAMVGRSFHNNKDSAIADARARTGLIQACAKMDAALEPIDLLQEFLSRCD